MAGELQHAPALPNSAQLTQAEFESLDRHRLNDGVAEDIIKWDGTKFVRVPKGADGTYLGYSGGVLGASTPGSATSSVTITTSTAYLVQPPDVILVDTTAGPIVLTLPALAAATKVVRIKRITDDANDLTLDAWSTEEIEQDTVFVLPGGGRSAVVVVPDLANLNWWVT